MTKQKAFSTFSIAAIALVAAAVPSLAQGQSESSGKSPAIAGATSAVEPTIASNLESPAVSKFSAVTPEVEPAANVAGNVKPMVLSSFKGKNNFTTSTSIQQMSFNEAAPIDPQAKTQFRADETELSRTKQVTFVASRGQKMPE